MIWRKRRRIIVITTALVITSAFGLLASNLMPDQAFAIYSVSRRCTTALYSESVRWATAATHQEELPDPKRFSPSPILPYNGPAEKKQQGVEWAGHILHEIKSLRALPQTVQNMLGAQEPGLDGIADRGGRYNATDVVDRSLPMRLFLVGGLDGDAALIAVEHGGFGWSVEVMLFSNIGQTPVVQRTWGLFKAPRTLQAFADAVPPR